MVPGPLALHVLVASGRPRKYGLLRHCHWLAFQFQGLGIEILLFLILLAVALLFHIFYDSLNVFILLFV